MMFTVCVRGVAKPRGRPGAISVFGRIETTHPRAGLRYRAQLVRDGLLGRVEDRSDQQYRDGEDPVVPRVESGELEDERGNQKDDTDGAVHPKVQPVGDDLYQAGLMIGEGGEEKRC